MKYLEFTPYFVASLSSEYADSNNGSFSKKVISNLDLKFDIQEGIFYSDSRGTFTKIKVRGDEIIVEPDFLGTRAVFYFQSKDVAIAANDISLMVSALKQLNLDIEVDYISLSANFSFGGLQTRQTPIKGVYILPLGKRIIMRGGNIYIESIDIGQSLVTKETLRVRASEEILGNVESIANSNDERIIVEMTGGVDSRITFSAVMAAGLRDRVDFVTYGGSEHPDRIIAEKIAAAFDIDMIVRPYSEQDISAEDYLKGGSAFAGVRWMDDVSFRLKNKSSGFIALTGNLGETFRNFYAEVGNKKHGKLNDYFLKPANSDNAASFFDAFNMTNIKYVKKSKETRDAVVSQILSYGESIGQSLFKQYSEFRNRLHYGGATVNRSRFIKSYDPLYTPSGYILAQRMDPEWQLFGELSFELMADYFPPILSITLAEKKFAPLFSRKELAKRCIISTDPMAGIKRRSYIEDINKYNVTNQKPSLKINDYFDQNLNKIPSDFLNTESLIKDIGSKDEKFRIRMHKALASSIAFLELIEK